MGDIKVLYSSDILNQFFIKAMSECLEGTLRETFQMGEHLKKKNTLILPSP